MTAPRAGPPEAAISAWGEGVQMRGQVRALARAALGSARLTTAGVGGGPAPDDRDQAQPTRDPDSAVRIYPWEHYAYWADSLGARLTDGAFGEDVTSVGLIEKDVFVGDTFRWGPAVLQVSQPWDADRSRPGFPPHLHAEMLRTRRTGFCCRVLSGGAVSSADPLLLDDVDPFGLSIADLVAAAVEGPARVGLTSERVLLVGSVLAARWTLDFVERQAAPSRSR